MPDEITGEIPEEPESPEWIDPIWQAYWRLSLFRGQDMMGGPLRITAQAMRDDADAFGPDDLDDFHDFRTIIARLDDVWFEHIARRASKGG